MKRNTALFGASLVAGLAAASGLIATSTTSSAAAGDKYYGVAWADGTSGQSSGWKTGAYADPYGVEFSGAAALGSGTFKLAAGGSTVAVKTTCVSGKPSVTVAGGGAAGTYTGGSVSMAKFTGYANALGTVTFATRTLSGHSVGAFISFSPGLNGTWVALTGADCAATGPTSTPPSSTTTSSSTSTSPTTSPTSSTSTSPTTSPTSTGTSTSTSPTTSPTTSPSSSTTAPPTTEPPTPTPTTTTLPVTG